MVAVFLCAWAGSGGLRADAAEPPVDYNRDIGPILSDNCYACHGFDEKQRKAGLRLDEAESAQSTLKDGAQAVVPGKPDESELVFRVETDDETLHMPPKEFGKTLSAEQKALLRRWIEQGAPFERHWAFEPPKKPGIPEVSDPAWPRNEVDRFLLSRLDQEGLKPSPEADRTTLIRRVTLDLTGLPPTPAEVAAFLADDRPDAYEILVDRLLESPRFGEHMARFWLDAARYGDTHGLHLDNYREIWPYRDWVIEAFNQNKPFDEFIVEQTAGDLLENPSLDQLVATGFNRAHVTTSEGGSIEEEVYVRNVVDRVETNGTVFLGLTIGCARCHDHKYDPIKTKDFYSLFAFFNSLDGPALDGNGAAPPPVVKVPSPEQTAELARLDGEIAARKQSRNEAVAKVPYDRSLDANQPEYVHRSDYVWFDDAIPSGSKPSEPEGPAELVGPPDAPVLSGSASFRQTFEAQGQRYFTDAPNPLVLGEGDSFFVSVFLDPVNPPKEIMLQWHIGGQWMHRAYWGENLIEYGKDKTTERRAMGPLPKTGEWVRLEVDIAKLGLKPGTKVDGWAFTQHGGTVYFDQAGLHTWTPQPGQTFETLSAWIASQKAVKGEGLPKELVEAINLPRDKRTAEQTAALERRFVETGWSKTREILRPFDEEIAALESARATLDKAIPTTLVYREMAKPKSAFVLTRGEYDQHGEPVERTLPAFLPPLPEGAPNNRLGLARWLVSRENPLVARVTVNRLWQQVFGVGIVKTAEDFGAQGDPPSHPELLDWLAVQFVDDGWDVKQFIKRLVTSAAYRQQSSAGPELRTRDPHNRLLARGPRFRLDAETLRDQALYASGLLVEHVGGPSVKPPQPAGLWEAVGYSGSNTVKFVADSGVQKVHRRSLYTFWKRTAPPPEMSTFDAPSRESCTVRRERTNTPLQALVLMNDPQFVEPARALGERAMKEGGSTPEDRARFLFETLTARAPEPSELAVILATYQDHLAKYSSDPESAKQLLSVGERPVDAALAPAELAAWTMIANLLLNLDEVITKG